MSIRSTKTRCAFRNIEGDAHRERFFIAVKLWGSRRQKRSRTVRRFPDRLSTVSSTSLASYQSPFFIRKRGSQRVGFEVADLAIDLYITEFVTFAFFDHIGDDEVLLVRASVRQRQTPRGSLHSPAVR
jgi:hypothetical protein